MVRLVSYPGIARHPHRAVVGDPVELPLLKEMATAMTATEAVNKAARIGTSTVL